MNKIRRDRLLEKLAGLPSYLKHIAKPMLRQSMKHRRAVLAKALPEEFTEAQLIPDAVEKQLKALGGGTSPLGVHAGTKFQRGADVGGSPEHEIRRWITGRMMANPQMAPFGYRTSGKPAMRSRGEHKAVSETPASLKRRYWRKPYLTRPDPVTGHTSPQGERWKLTPAEIDVRRPAWQSYQGGTDIESSPVGTSAKSPFRSFSSDRERQRLLGRRGITESDLRKLRWESQVSSLARKALGPSSKKIPSGSRTSKEGYTPPGGKLTPWGPRYPKPLESKALGFLRSISAEGDRDRWDRLMPLLQRVMSPGSPNRPIGRVGRRRKKKWTNRSWGVFPGVKGQVQSLADRRRRMAMKDRTKLPPRIAREQWITERSRARPLPAHMYRGMGIDPTPGTPDPANLVPQIRKWVGSPYNRKTRTSEIARQNLIDEYADAIRRREGWLQPSPVRDRQWPYHTAEEDLIPSWRQPRNVLQRAAELVERDGKIVKRGLGHGFRDEPAYWGELSDQYTRSKAAPWRFVRPKEEQKKLMQSFARGRRAYNRFWRRRRKAPPAETFKQKPHGRRKVEGPALDYTKTYVSPVQYPVGL